LLFFKSVGFLTPVGKWLKWPANCCYDFEPLGIQIKNSSNMKTVWVVALAAVFSLAARAEQIGGRVVTVVDGNTIEVACADGEAYKIMLFGIDSPELGQPYGEEARTALEKLVLNREVVIDLQGKDRWGNRLGIISIPDAEDPRTTLLRQGLAWTAERNPLPELEALRQQAERSGKGLWKTENPTPPWQYRRQQTLTQHKSS
jgi:endonuclease YncB( thermonuclease family)